MNEVYKFESTHKLEFEVAPWIFPAYMRFRIGSCEGLWCSTNTSYDILAITNTQPHNQNLQDVFDWFKMSCLRDKKDFRILELWNKRFMGYLLRNGFQPDGDGAIMFYEDICKESKTRITKVSQATKDAIKAKGYFADKSKLNDVVLDNE